MTIGKSIHWTLAVCNASLAFINLAQGLTLWALINAIIAGVLFWQLTWD